MNARTGAVIDESMCHIPKENTFLPHTIFQKETCGPESVALAAHELASGFTRVVAFAVCDHPQEGGKIHDMVTVGVHSFMQGQRREIMFVGGQGKISGPASHILCVDAGNGILDAAEIAARLVYCLLQSYRGWIFRLKENDSRWED